MVGLIGALMFDGVDDGIEVEDNTDYSKGITIDMYIKLRGKKSNDLVQILMMKRSHLENGFFMFLGNGEMGFKYGELSIDIGGTPSRFNTGIIIEDNEPTYISYTYDPNLKQGIAYINGEERARTTNGDIQKLIKAKTSTIQIGSDIHESFVKGQSYPFNGEIYLSRVYNRPLTAQEVQLNYNTVVENP